MEQAASVTASALLQGARGNSGVILSLLFRGLSKALKGMETADAAAFAAAMQEAWRRLQGGYEARRGHGADGFPPAKRAVAGQAAEGTDVEVLEAAIEEGYAALAQTTE